MYGEKGLNPTGVSAGAKTGGDGMLDLLTAEDEGTGMVIPQHSLSDCVLVPAYLLKGLVSKVQALGGAIESLPSGLVASNGPDGAEGIPRRGSSIGKLTPRELEVLSLLAQGYSNGGIAERLSIRPRTVETHINGIYHSLNVSRDACINPRVLVALDFIDHTPPGHSNHTCVEEICGEKGGRVKSV